MDPVLTLLCCKTFTGLIADKDLVSCVGWTTADELYSSG